MNYLIRVWRRIYIALLEPMAVRGYIYAQYKLGKLYYEARGGELPKAFAWFTLAASHGHVAAKSELALLDAKLPLDKLEEGRKLAMQYRRMSVDSSKMRKFNG